MARLTLTFLGSLQASLDGKPLPALRSARIQALLAYLVLEAEHVHTRETLAALLWPDEPDQVAKQNLRQALYQLRQALGESPAPGGIPADEAPFFLATRDTVQFNPASDYTLDVTIFLQALQEGRHQAAVELYQAALLNELASESDRFEEWLLLQREQLHLLAMRSLQQLTEQALAQAAYAEAQQLARRQLALEPWREAAHRQLISALAAAGEQAAALAQFETCRDLLRRELGVEPEAATLALMERVQSAECGMRSAESSITPTGKAGNFGRTELTTDGVNSALPTPHSAFIDWGDAPDIGVFYGRDQELQELRRWLIDQRCRLLVVLGMGGMGKTTLTAQLARQNVEHFAFVLWHSLLNAPTLRELLESWLRVLSGQQLAQIPTGLDAQLNLLFEYLRKHRCLLVLDNTESIMQGGERAGYYRTGYEEYGQLLLRIGQSNHQSCLLLTSREQPREISRLAAETPLVRTVTLLGLEEQVGRQLLRARGVEGSGESLTALIERYSGNPLALKLIAETIQDFFDGDIEALLGEQTLIFDDIRDVLEQQFARLAPLERDLLLWLALEREPITENQLWQRFARAISRRSFLEALRSLLHRSLVENFVQDKQGGGFGLQNVVTEFLTDSLITQSCAEFATLVPVLLHSHALISTQAKEYVRQSQERVILQPMGERLLATHGRAQLISRGKQLLENMRRNHAHQPSFLAGNLLNLFLHLGIDLRGYDFSDLNVWQAYLRGADLPGLNFSHADLTHSVFTDYAGAVTAVAFSPNGQLLAAGADSGVIYLWRVADRQLIGLCQGHTSHVWSLAFSPTGQQLLSGSGDATVRLWDVEARQLLRLFVGHTGGVSTVGFHPAGELVVSGSLDQQVRIWHAATGQILQTLAAESAKVEAVAFAPWGHPLLGAEGTLLAVGGHDQVVRLWDWQQGQIVRTLQGHMNLIKVVGFCPRPQWLNGARRSLVVGGGDDQTLRVWDAATGELLHCLTGHTAAIISLAFSQDGAWLFSGSDDQTIRVWDVQSGQTVRILPGHYGTVRSLAMQPLTPRDQPLLASGSYDKTVRLWDWQNGRTLAILRGHSKWLQALVFKSNAQGQAQLLVSGSDGQTVRVWDGDSGQVLHTLRGHTSLTEKIAFRPDGAQLASASWDQTVRLWDLHTGQTRYLLRGHTGAVATAVFGRSPQGLPLLATGGLDRTVRLWDSATGQTLAIWHGHQDRVVGFAFRPDGGLLASASWDGAIGLWDIQREEFITFLRGHTETVESVAFHPSGELLASASWDRTVRIWNVGTGRTLHVLQGHHDGLEMVTFSPDGRLLASCGCDHLICVWEVQSGRLLYQLQGHTSWVRCIAFHPDRAILASGSDDGTVKLWDVTPVGGGCCLQTVAMDDPYTGMNITGVTGISEAQKAALRALGAVEQKTEDRGQKTEDRRQRTEDGE
ncbi:MAG: BTAD domain-containing putative transcriptional regulator [Caldilineaceae bacterium]